MNELTQVKNHISVAIVTKNSVNCQIYKDMKEFIVVISLFSAAIVTWFVQIESPSEITWIDGIRTNLTLDT